MLGKNTRCMTTKEEDWKVTRSEFLDLQVFIIAIYGLFGTDVFCGCVGIVLEVLGGGSRLVSLEDVDQPQHGLGDLFVGFHQVC